MFEPSKVYEKIKKYPIISFDIFDTLVKRNVPEPKVIFDVVEEAFNQEYPEYSIHGFREQRIQAERRARQLCQKEEIKFEQIYGQLGWEQELCRKLKELEIETEVKYCQPNYLLKELYDKCIAAGRRVVITSDMYLPQEVIVRILQKCGYTQYEKLYLSSEIGLRKRTGKLFDYILQDLKVGKKDIVHVGDGRYVDYLLPRLKGLASVHITRHCLNTHFLGKNEVFKQNSRLYAFINNNLPRYGSEPDLFQWGYEALGPLLLGFTTWVHGQICANGIEKAYFLARDMYLVVDIYRQLYGSSGVEYLEVSRKSLRESYVKKKQDFAAVFDTLSRRNYSVEEVLAAFGLEREEFQKEFDLSTHISLDNARADSFGKLNDAVLAALRKQKNLAEEYLSQMGLFAHKKIALVDIGWHATTQNMLECLLEKSLLGLYFGGTVRYYYRPMRTMGYWFNFKDEAMALPFMSMIYILEVMLFPQLGTTTGYVEKQGRIWPCYGSCEMEKCKEVEKIQRGARAFVSDYLALESSIKIINGVEATAAFQKLAFEPTVEQAQALATIPLEDGKIFCLAVAHPFEKYLSHPLSFYRDYKAARWKEGFIKQVLPFMPRVHIVLEVGRKLKRLAKNNIGCGL